MKSVAVLMGGWSPEREVSLSSGYECAKALADRGYAVRVIDVGRDLPALLRALEPRPDVIFNALHGIGGEDGTIQGVFEMLVFPIPIPASWPPSVAMHKPTAKSIFRAVGLPVVDGVVARPEELALHDPMPAPFVVKPTNQGSQRWRPDRAGQRQFLARRSDGLVLWQRASGRALCSRARADRRRDGGSRAWRLRNCPARQLYDYTAKYAVGGSDHLIPAPIPAEVYERALDIALRAHRALGCRGVTRADLRYDDATERSEGLYLLELNTQPGMTPTSLVPDIARHVGIEFDELVAWMVENAACDG